MDDLSKWFISGGFRTAPVAGIVPEPLEDGVYLPCDGRMLKVDRYPMLFDLINYHYGGIRERFCIPDLRVHGKLYIRVK